MLTGFLVLVFFDSPLFYGWMKNAYFNLKLWYTCFKFSLTDVGASITNQVKDIRTYSIFAQINLSERIMANQAAVDDQSSLITKVVIAEIDLFEC